MQDYSGYQTYLINQDGTPGYHTDPRIHGNQPAVSWNEVSGRQDESGIQYSTHYIANGWDPKSFGHEIQEEEYFHTVPVEPEPRKRKRRRVISVEQRRAANIRERKRMFQLNEAFCVLRKRVPTFAYEKKLSRIETLKLAVTYIKFMTELLEKEDAKPQGGGDNMEIKDETLGNAEQGEEPEDILEGNNHDLLTGDE